MIKVYYCYVGEHCARVVELFDLECYLAWVRARKPVLRAWGATWDIFQRRLDEHRVDILPRLETCEHYQIKGIITKFLAERCLEW